MPRWIDDLVGYNQILADDGTPARRRHILKFVGATVADDGEATVVTTSGATTQAEFFLGAADPALPNHRLPVESSTIGWNLATPNTFVAFVKPGSVLAAMQFREQDVDVAQRDKFNVVNTASISLDFTDDAIAEEIELRAIRAALTGAISADLGVNATKFAGVRDNNALETARTFINILNTPSVLMGVNSDSIDDELEIFATRAALTGAITAAQGSNATAFGAAASLSVLANATNGVAVPAYLAAAAAREHLRVNAAGTALEWSLLQLADFPVIASDTFLANTGIAPAAPTAVALSSIGGDGIDWDGTNNRFDIVVSDFVGTGLENDGSNNIRIAAAAAGNGLTGGSGVALAVGAGTGITVNANDVQIATVIAESFFGNFTAGVAVPTARAGSSVAGNGLTYTAGGTLAVGTGTGIQVNADDVQLAPLIAESFFGNFTAGSAVGTARAGSSVAGNGLTYTAGGTLAVGASTSIIVAANDIQRAAITGAISAGQNVNTTQFAGIRDNGILETARTFLNFVSTASDTVFSLTQDAGADEIEVRLSTLGSFYSENSVGSIQTKFISFDDGDLLEAQVTDNTGGSGFINVTYNLNLPTDTSIANIGEGSTVTGEARVSRDDMYRWLASQPNVRVFEEEFLGNLAACTARFSVVSGFAGFPTLSAVSTSKFNGAVNLQNTSPAGTTRGVWTLGANESALNFHWDSVRYLCIVFRTGSATVVANTQMALGLVGPFDTYGAVTASALGGTSEGIFIEYVTTLSSGEFRVGYRKSSSTSTSSTGVVVAANTQYVYELFRTASGDDYHYLDGALMRTDAAGIAPTNNPCTFFATILGSTTATRNFQVDAIKVISQTTNRH